MKNPMNKSLYRVVFSCVVALLSFGGYAQNNTYHSVLGENTWHRFSVTKEGIYKLDYATLERMGIDMSALDPNQIRLFGNPSGVLPEKNSVSRPDDLTEMAISVVGAEDGVFDRGDVVYFYGQEPTRWKLTGNSNNNYQRERNPYSDTTYYYLCTDSGTDGMRVGEKTTLPVEGTTTVISEFPDFVWHEEELFSPYNLGQNWFGESLSLEDTVLSLQLLMPNLVKDKMLRVKSRVYGRVKGQTMRYDIMLNDTYVVNNSAIASYGSNYYAKESSYEGMTLSESDTLTVTIRLRNSPSAALYLDFVEIYGWRQLRRIGDIFSFRLMPSQFGDDASAVWIQDANAQCQLWEVTAPLRPVVQECVVSGGNMVFALDERVEKRYVLFNPLAAMEVEHVQAIANQNVHAIADADMLILTASLFKEQAQALADYHAEKDRMHCEVVDVEEIYNEFSTGIPDPTGIRDFVRMVYKRSAGNLKYLTLYGRPSFDFRNIKGVGQNYVPTYETMNRPEYELSFCSDDYFGLMDDNEGTNCDGYVDLGIGRLPVATVEEAETVLRKIRHYDDLVAVHGSWKTDLLIVADDEDKPYFDNSETYYQMTDTICPPLTAKKIYCGAYPVTNTTSGTVNQGANADLMQALDDGAIAMLYTGHGGVSGLTGENVFTNSDIAALHNYDKVPFLFTATCEFTKYDNPLLVSAGERMFLNPQGGTVAMLTASRPTHGFNNVKMGKALMEVMYQRDREGQPLRFGDIIRMTKINPINYLAASPMESQNIRFLFLGDPALRFALPEENVVVCKINGVAAETAEPRLHAMSMVAIEGEVRTASGEVDTDFNGEAWVKFFDKQSRIKVTHSGGVSNAYYHKDVLYQGRVSVREGKFNVAFQVPKDIRLDYGQPRFSFYAYDSIRNIDAMGMFNRLTLGGTDPTMLPDDQGPNISFYWNTPDFENGAHVEREGVLYAELYDAQGIYHYDYSLGRDIVMTSNLTAYNNLVLNDIYEPVLNDYRRGRIAIPVADLVPGTYEFTLKAWDTQDNSSEANLWFVIDDDLFLSQVHNFPNPFNDETRIILSHVGDDGDFDVNIEVFDIMGRPVAQIAKRVSSTNGVMEPIRWSGCNNAGTPLRSGVYLYRLTLTDETGYFRTVSQRMVISR